MAKSWLFFDLDRTLWDFERNSLETLKGLFVDADLKAKGVADFDAFNTVYQRENKACWDLYLAGQMTKPVLRTTRFRRALEGVGGIASTRRNHGERNMSAEGRTKPT